MTTMKKFMASVLAVAMVASMSAVSFAAPGVYKDTANENYIEFDKKGDFDDITYVVKSAGKGYTYDSDDKAMVAIGSGSLEYGETVYFPLMGKAATAALTVTKTDATFDFANFTKDLAITQSGSVDGLKIKTNWEQGSKHVKKVYIAKMKVANASADVTIDGTTYVQVPEYVGAVIYDSSNKNDTEGVTDGKYYYFLAIDTNDSTSTSTDDVIGTVTLNKSRDPEVEDLDVSVAVEMGWNNNRDDKNAGNIEDEMEPEKYYKLDFKTVDDDRELSFKGGSTFTVDASGQPKTLIYFDTNFNSAISNKHPEAELEFWNGNGAKFNRVGEFFLSYESDYNAFLYEVKADGTLAKLNATYEEGDGFTFNTRTVGSYVISDTELNITPVAPVVPETPVVPSNPETGCIA